MNNFMLLESLNEIDDQLLQESENATYNRKPLVFKILLVAAIISMLSITALAVRSMFTDVSGGELVPTTFKITMTDAEWNVVEIGKRPGYCIHADIETFPDVPMKLLYPYLPTVPESWECTGAGHAKYDGEIGMVGIQWTYELYDTEYEVFYRQESAYFYNTGETPVVWWLDNLPEDVTVSGQTAIIGEASVYRVEVSGSKVDRNFYSYDRSLIFWSDGYSVFQLDVPRHWNDDLIYELMCSLTLQTHMENAISNLK